ncbi:MAG: hypothetical protein PUP93_24750 [Rhizonema sp. NSF051]|nr:hypothetical protein [Rhizonema sp. NSF051]
MSPALQRVMSELKQLTPEEQWKLLGYLMNQLQANVRLVTRSQPKVQPSVGSVSVDTLLAETSGTWGHLSIEEIDTKLKRQRQIDWGE